MLRLIIDEPVGKTIPVLKRTLVEALVNDIFLCPLAGCKLVSQSHGFGGYKVNI